jgi:ABC-type multidrug transport system fused ATPase/permease subunit
LARLLSLLGQRRWAYALWLLLAAGTLTTCFNIVLAWVMKDVLDAAVRRESALLARALLVAGGTFLVGLPAFLVSLYMMNRCVLEMMTDLRMRVFGRIVDLPMDRFERGHSGDLVSRCTNDLNGIQEAFSSHIYALAFGVMIGVGAMVSMFILDWRIGLLALLVGLLTTAAKAAFAGPLREASDAIQRHLAKLTDRLTDLLQSFVVAKMFRLEPVIHRRYAVENGSMVDATLRHARINALANVASDLVGNLARFGLPVVGLYLLMDGIVQVGTVWAVTHLLGNAGVLFESAGDFVARIQRALAGASRVFELLDWPAEQQFKDVPSGAAEMTVLTLPGEMVQISDLRFRYDTGDNGGNGAAGEVLRGITVAAQRGQVVALVGPSGGGKSTLVKLLMGLYPLQDGQVVIDGLPAWVYPLVDLRSKMAYVPQDAYLFDGTIAENIRYGKPEATRDEVIAVAEAANAHGFICEQPDGYDTLVGERGARLSGGQRQRIAIARALLKDAPILILDEATSALDSESERQVQAALDVLMAGRTTIAIAHRLSTVENADVIYVIDDGAVVEQGTHDELLDQGGLYTRLYDLRSSHHKETDPA